MYICGCIYIYMVLYGCVMWCYMATPRDSSFPNAGVDVKSAATEAPQRLVHCSGTCGGSGAKFLLKIPLG